MVTTTLNMSQYGDWDTHCQSRWRLRYYNFLPGTHKRDREEKKRTPRKKNKGTVMEIKIETLSTVNQMIFMFRYTGETLKIRAPGG